MNQTEKTNERELLPGQAYITVRAEWIDDAWRVMGLGEFDRDYGQLYQLFIPDTIYTQPTTGGDANVTAAINHLAMACEPNNETMSAIRTVRAALASHQPAQDVGQNSSGQHASLNQQGMPEDAQDRGISYHPTGIEQVKNRSDYTCQQSDDVVERALKHCLEHCAHTKASRDIVKAALSALPDKQVGEWLPIETAPKDGARVLLKFKDNLAQFDRVGDGRLDSFSGLEWVGRHAGFGKRGDFDMGWGFAAPVGKGGFADGWLVGWQPLPLTPQPQPKLPSEDAIHGLLDAAMVSEGFSPPMTVTGKISDRFYRALIALMEGNPPALTKREG